VNQLLEVATKSLDIELVSGLLQLLESSQIHTDSHTYELLIQMHFTTRNFKEVNQLSAEMQTKQLRPTARTSLIMLKAALQAGNLDESLLRFRELSLATDVPTASQAPKHIISQLVELACRERRLDVVLADMDAGCVPLSVDMVNTMLAESVRLKDRSIAEHVKELVTSQKFELDSKSYQYLIKGAGSDRQYISQLLKEMQQGRIECLHEVVTSILTSCSASSDIALADQLYELATTQSTIHGSSLLAFIRFYAEAGQPETACSIYDEHLKAQPEDSEKRKANVDSKTEKCLISASLQCGRKDIAADLVVSSPTDTAKHISMIRNSASKCNLEEAFNIFDSLETSGADLTHSLHNALLDACVECHDMERAEAFMRKMVAADRADAVSYNTLIKAHLNSSNFQGARNVMDTMRKAGCKPNPVTYNELINALVRSEKESQRAQVWDVVAEMKENSVRPNKITCSILFRSLKARSSQADVMRVMELTDTMEEPMDEVLMSSIIEACVRVGKPGLLTEKLEQLQGKNGIKVTGAHTFGSLIKAYGTAHDMDGAWRCWKAMRSQHVKPTSITIGCMVEAVVSNGDVDGGYELISQLLEDDKCRSQVNAVVFGSVLKGFGRAKQMDRMWEAFKEMLARGIEPSVVTYNAVIDSCVRNNQLDEIEGLLQDMKTRRITPNLITYSTVIKGLSQKGDMPAAFAVFKDLKQARVKPDDIVYNSMLDGCATAGLVAEGQQLLEDMQKDGLVPTNYTLTVLVRLMGQGRRLQGAFDVIDTFARKHRVRANAHVFTALLQACLTNRDLSRAADAIEQALRSRVQPDQRVCQSLIRAFVAAGKADYAANVLRALLGLSAARLPPLPKSSNASPWEDSFINDAVACLLDAGKDAQALAPALVADIRMVRPKLRLDSSIDRKLGLAVAHRHGNGDAKKSHPWSK
jgi:pentatricopeptide repeat protein